MPKIVFLKPFPSVAGGEVKEVEDKEQVYVEEDEGECTCLGTVPVAV